MRWLRMSEQIGGAGHHTASSIPPRASPRLGRQHGVWRGVRCAMVAPAVRPSFKQPCVGMHVPDAVPATPHARQGDSRLGSTLCPVPALRQVVIAPHIYCAGVSNSPLATSGQELYTKLDTTFGYLTATGAPRLGCGCSSRCSACVWCGWDSRWSKCTRHELRPPTPCPL